MKPKECNECGKTIMPKSKDAIWNHGYMNNMCRPCKRIEAKEYQKKIRKLKENTFWEVKYIRNQ